MKKNLIDIFSLSRSEIVQLCERAKFLKSGGNHLSLDLERGFLALLFMKPSNRTRLSFEVAAFQMGMGVSFLKQTDVKLGERESVADVARVLSRYVDAVVLRVFSHLDVLEFSRYATCSVINGLSDQEHPCQALADIMTIQEYGLENQKIVYVGDFNNVFTSLLYVCSKLGVVLEAAFPEDYAPPASFLDHYYGSFSSDLFHFSYTPQEIVEGASVIYTDVWASMGISLGEDRLYAFRSFQVNKELLSYANKGVKVMHCLPAHRGQEITSDVMDGSNSIVFDQAENRLHMHKAILEFCLSEKG